MQLQFIVAQNGTEPVLLTDMLKNKTEVTTLLSPDAKKSSFTLTSIEGDEK
jgi:hypothetical protein